MKTAIQELILTAKIMSKLSGDSGFVGRSMLAIIENENLLEKEKQQIIEAHFNGYENGNDYARTGIGEFKDAEQYYNKTFKD